MPLIATTGAIGAGGAVFVSADTSPGNPYMDGGQCVKVGDTAICPGHSSPVVSTVLTGSASVFVNGVAVALVGSACSCGHPIISPGANHTCFAT